MAIRNEILSRTYVVFACIALVGGIIFIRAVHIGIFQGSEWRAKATEMYVKSQPIEAQRGNIYAHDGSLLATSLPYYDVFWDPTVVPQDTFDFYVDELARLVATYINNEYTIGGLRDKMLESRTTGFRYLPIAKSVSYPNLQKLQQFPLFNKGKFKGGLIVNQINRRQRPFKMMAARTIGRYKLIDDIDAQNNGKDTTSIGIEGAFNEFLQGAAGERMMQNVGGNIWIPVNDISEIESKAGMDIVTTIDIDIQDASETALLNCLKQYDADGGCAMVMDVETGALKAIANISRQPDGSWWESYNYAVGMSIEPGSTFKLATMMALIEDNYIRINDSIDVQHGKAKFYNEEMEDAVDHGLGMTTIQRAFEVSSNVGMAKLVDKYYNHEGRETSFLKHLNDFQLNNPTGIELGGEPTPYIKTPKSSDWSGITLPWMATGYEMKITPLQLMTFYNAVANNGRMMKPYIVEEIRDYGKLYKSFKPEVIKRGIANTSTIKTVKKLLQGVVDNGTAKAIHTDQYTIAGKTGTAIMNYGAYNKGREGKKYLASFAGFFPVENPMYTIVVCIYNPRMGLYGGTVAAPVFKEIADKCFASNFSKHTALNDAKKEKLTTALMPDLQAGYKDEIVKLLRQVDLGYYDKSETDWVVMRAENDSLKFLTRNFQPTLVPNVVGMGLRDAVYLLENRGIKVRPVGVGRVKSQSVKPGQNVKNVRAITLVLE